MPISIFKARGQKAINDLDTKVSEWLETSGQQVKQISTAISETSDNEPLYVLTIWHELND
jgi:hypothetical protein